MSASSFTSTNRDLLTAIAPIFGFRHYGQRWVLQEIVARGTAQQLTPNKLETEYAKAKPVEEKIVVATVNK